MFSSAFSRFSLDLSRMVCIAGRCASVATVCLAACVCLLDIQDIQAQTAIPPGEALEAGVWTGFMQNPGGSPFGVTIHAPAPGDSSETLLRIEHLQQDVFRVEGARVIEGFLTLSWWPAFRIDCELEREPDGVFVGICSDEDASMGPATLAPPGLATSADRLSRERVDQRIARLERSMRYRELDLLDGPRGTKVDVGGYGLYALDEGEGMPVVFLSDLGEDLRVWDYAHHDVQAFARAISYSRSGLGYSDPAPSSGEAERTPAALAEELHALLKGLSAEPPYVLAAHGLGAVIARVFAARYPDAVAGLVLAEPAHEQEMQRLSALDKASADRYMAGRTMLYSLASDAERAEFAFYEEMMETGALPGGGDMPDVPVVILTSLRLPETPRWVGETEAGIRAKAALRDEWLEGFAWRRHVQTRRSGTWFHREAPDFVVEAIREVMDAALKEIR